MGRVPTAFASSTPLGEDELRASGGPHTPRPSALAEPLELKPAPAAKGAERLGLLTVGDLLEHLPRDRSEARTIAELGTDEVATVAVEVRSITSRPVRRRGMKPLVEATVADQTGIMKVTFFNQPWLERRYRPGTRLMLQGKYQGRNQFRVQFHAETGELVGATGDVATYPATDGLSTTQIAALVHDHRAALRDVVEPLPSRAPRRRRLARPRRRPRRGPLRRRRARARAARVRGAAAAAARPAAAARAAARGGPRRGARGAAVADRALARGVAPVHADRRPARRDGRDRRGPRVRAPDAAAADGRGRARARRSSRSTRCCARSSTAARRR